MEDALELPALIRPREDSFYDGEAQAFVDGRSDTLLSPLCLRAPLLNGIRRLNSTLGEGSRVRVHLTDIDSPAGAILRHLAAIRARLDATGVRLPSQGEIKSIGRRTVADLRRLSADSGTRRELRTVDLSIVALQQGLEVDVAAPKGSPYLNSREEAIARNLVDLVRTGDADPLLVIYGDDHVARTPRKDGGPRRDQPFEPLAARLDRAGLRTFNVITFPLAGRSAWRGRRMELPWTAADGHLTSGEPLDHVLAAIPAARFLYIDAKRERVTPPSQDLSRAAPDAFLLFSTATPMRETCHAPEGSGPEMSRPPPTLECDSPET
jgi:hypothetical protein